MLSAKINPEPFFLLKEKITYEETHQELYSLGEILPYRVIGRSKPNLISYCTDRYCVKEYKDNNILLSNDFDGERVVVCGGDYDISYIFFRNRFYTLNHVFSFSPSSESTRTYAGPDKAYGFLKAILESPKDRFNYMVLADYLLDLGDDFGNYILEVMDKVSFVDYSHLGDFKYEDLRLVKYMVLIMLQDNMIQSFEI